MEWRGDVIKSMEEMARRRKANCKRKTPYDSVREAETMIIEQKAIGIIREAMAIYHCGICRNTMSRTVPPLRTAGGE